MIGVLFGCAGQSKDIRAERIQVREIYLVDETGKPCGFLRATNGETTLALCSPGKTRNPEVVISSGGKEGTITLKSGETDRKTLIGPAAVFVSSTEDGEASLMPVHQ